MRNIKNLSGILRDRHRQVIHAVVEEVTATPVNEQSELLQLMPLTDVPAAVLEHEIISGAGGKTLERQLNSEGKGISGASSESVLYKPGSYQEFIAFNERDLLQLRKFGSLGERGVVGLTSGELDMMARAASKLQRRLNNRIHQLGWDAIFNDQFVYQGVTKTFGRPAANVISTATDWAVANTGTPFDDLVNIMGNNPVLRKYRNIIKGFIINPKTESDIIRRSLEQGYVSNANISSAGINVVRQFAAPGLPEFTVVSDAIQEETVDPITGKITLGNAEYLVPDNKVLVVLDFDQAGVLFSKYGEIQLTENMNGDGATIERPATGMYTFIDEEGLRNRKNPSVDVVSGFNGGPNLMRPDDVIIIEY